MNDRVDPLNLQEATEELAKKWGWDAPNDEIMEMATKSVFSRNAKVGDIIVDWGILDRSTVDRYMSRKPQEIQALSFLAGQEPKRVLPVVEQILALKSGFPYYENLSMLQVHEAMKDKAIIQRCEELDVVMMSIDGKNAVLVFSTFNGLLKFSTQGSAKEKDPLYKASKQGAPLLAVGARDDIAAIYKMHHNEIDAGANEGGGKLWNATSEDTQEGRDITRILDHALIEGATDISIRPEGRNGSVKVMMRKFGDLINPFSKTGRDGKIVETIFQPEAANKIVTLLAARSGANPTSARIREPIDGQITYRSTVADSFMRLNFIPLNHLGSIKDLVSISVRLFSRNETTLMLKDLHIPDDVAQQIRDAVQMPQGLILVSGPVNSGKSSTISGAIGEHYAIYGDTKRRLSVEDPIERHLKGITQINVPNHIQDPAERFLVVLRALKRHDLNLLWVGEVRDKLNAEFCVHFASSGHLVLSTIHAKDSILAFDILANSVAQSLRFQLADSMAMSISQRLVRTLCSCAHDFSEPTAQEKHLFELNKKATGETNVEMPKLVKRANHEGCDKCDNGYAGSRPILEVLPFTREVKDAAISLASGDNPKEQRRILAEKRTVTLLQSGVKLLEKGEVDVQSILFF